ncbi:MAG: leucine-rich repeat protein, partial [Clostridia bacterium]|nr:leucine-rich repeat protein [Clostridia bacterium]
LTIPDTVTLVGENAFSGTGWLAEQPDGPVYIGKVLYQYKGTMPENTELTVKPGTVRIASYAFIGCYQLTGLTLPEGLLEIHGGALSNCVRLAKINFPESLIRVSGLPTNAPWYKALPDGVVYIGKVAYGYKGIMPDNTTLTLRDGTVLIGPSAFENQNHLAAVVIPGSVNEIGSGAFRSCDGLTRIDIPESVKSIGAYAFKYDNGLKEVSLRNGLVSIETGAFQACVSLKSVDIPGSVTSIKNQAFYGCRDLQKVTFHEGLTSIGTYAFRRCEALTEIVLPESLQSIDSGAFWECTALTDVSVPKNVSRIGNSAFAHWGDAQTHEVVPENAVYYETNHCIIKKEDLSVVSGCNDSVLPDNITAIVYNAFAGRTKLTEIAIPDTVTSLGGFSDCTGLSSLDIPDSVTEIGEYAFSDCTGLTGELVIPDSVTFIGQKAFSGCAGLTGIRLSDQLTETDYGAFYGCTGLTEIAIPKSVMKLGNSTFENCKNLASVSLVEGLTSIGYYAFRGCASLAGINVPASVTEIEYDAIPSHTVIYGRPGSYAETWAKENNRAFTVLDEAYLTMYTAPAVNEPTAEAYGFATPGAQVKLSLDGKEAATVTAAGSGRWSAILPLTGAQDGKSLTLKAEVTYNRKTVSAEAKILYATGQVLFRELTLFHHNYRETVTQNNVGYAVPNFTVAPGQPFAFRVAVSNSDRIEKLWVVSTENGVSKKMALAYNEVTGQWFSGEGFFEDTDRNYVPGVFTVEGVDKDGKAFDCGVTIRFRFLIDPSGYVYEAVQSNKIEGATVSVCYKDEEGRELLWNAAEAGQTNPITTLADGAFAWDVPKGQWQVQVSKEGYATVKSDWMDVPPEWKDVFLALETRENPTVKALYLCRDHADILFSTYMDIESVNTGTVVFDGYTGKIEPLDKTETAENSGVFYATAFRFTPDKPFADAVTVRLQEAAEADADTGTPAKAAAPAFPVPGETDGDENGLGVWTRTYDYSDIKNYAGKKLYTCTGTFAVTEEPKDLSVEQTASVTYGKTAEIAVSAANAGGRTVSVSCDSAILTLSQKTVTLDEEGRAALTVTGEMPGTAKLTFALEGTDLTAAAEVTVVLPEKPEVMPGDVDGDGELTSGDARLALRASVKLEDYAEDSAAYIAADVDHNGTIESSDARLILRASVKLEDPTKW